MKRPSGSQITILILSILLLAVCLGAFYEFFFKPFTASLRNKAWGEDAERARQLCGYVSQRITPDEKSSTGTNKPAVLWDAGRNFARLEIYRVTNPEEQEQIFTAIKQWQTTNQALSKICVQFVDSFKLLREEFIVLTNAQSGVIFNQAATKN